MQRNTVGALAANYWRPVIPTGQFENSANSPEHELPRMALRYEKLAIENFVSVAKYDPEQTFSDRY
jgi:hypothetical protein